MSYNPGLTDTQLRATALPVSGTVAVTGVSTSALQTTGNSSLSSIDGKIPTLGQALAGASTPVVLTAAQIATLTPPAAITGFSTETTLAALSAKITTVNTGAVVLAAGAAAIGSVSVTGSVAVTGAFFQTTQPVSAASLPLPTGAATETTLAAISTKTPALGQATMANSQPVTIASNQSALNVADVNASTGPTAFTASDAVGAAPDGVGTPINAASTAGSIVSIAVPPGMESWTMQMTAYGTGAVYSEASVDSTNGTDGNWVAVKGRRTGTAVGVESVVYTMVANGTYRGNCAGFTYLRARLIGTGTPSIKFILSAGSGATFLNSGIPGGTSSIGTVILGAGSAIAGKVGIDQTTPGTTNLVSIGTNGVVALGAGAAAIGSVTVTGTTAVSAASLPLPAGAATETTLAALNTKVTAVNTGAVTISAALPAGANTIGTTTGPTLTKGTQGTTGYSTQDLKDGGRAIVNVATVIAGVTCVTAEALLSMNVSRDGAATAAVTSIAVTSGKRYRITGLIASARSSAATVLSARVALRINPAGAATATSTIIAIASMTQQAAALAEAGDTCVLTFPDGIEVSGTMQVGLSQVCSGIGGVVYASLIGYEY